MGQAILGRSGLEVNTRDIWAAGSGPDRVRTGRDASAPLGGELGVEAHASLVGNSDRRRSLTSCLIIGCDEFGGGLRGRYLPHFKNFSYPARIAHLLWYIQGDWLALLSVWGKQPKRSSVRIGATGQGWHAARRVFPGLLTGRALTDHFQSLRASQIAQAADQVLSVPCTPR